MKKILTVLFAIALSLSLAVAFAACETNDDKGKENVITATLGKTEATVGEEVTVTYSASDGTVTVTYSKDGGAAVSFTGNVFTASEAGTYVFTFKSEGAADVVKTLTVTAAVEPVVPVITASADKTSIYAGETVTLTWSATENAVVSVSYTKDDEAANTLQPVSGGALTIEEAGVYVFKFSAEGAESKTVTVEVKAKPVITVTVDGGETITEGDSITFTFSCSDESAVSVAVQYNGTPEEMTVLSGTPIELSKVGEYVFTFSAANAVSVEKTITVSAHTHSYGEWTQVSAPTESSEGQIKRECTFNGCDNFETQTLPELKAENVAAEPTEGKYTYAETPSSCTTNGTGTYTYYLDAFEYEVTLPLAAHTFTGCELSYSEEMSSDNWTCTVKCSVCGKGEKEFSVPKAVSASSDSGWTQVSVEKQPSCVEGSGTYEYTFEQDGYTVTVTVSGVVIPASGAHHYENIEFVYSDLQDEITDYTKTISCTGNCGTTLTIQGLPNFDVPDTWDIQIKKEPTCGEDGLADCTYTYTADDSSGQSVTISIKATQVTVGATGEHNYVYALNTETGELGVTCSECDYSSSFALASIEITAAPEYLVMQSNGDIDLSAFKFEAIFDGTGETAVIPAESILNSAVFSNKVKYEETTVTFTFFGKSVTSESLLIYEEKEGGTVTASEYLPKAVELGTAVGEFEYRFHVGGLTNGAGNWNSWLVQFTAGNGAFAVLRADAFVLDNFGRKADDLGSGFGQNGLTWEGATWQEIQGAELDFVIARTYAEGGYTITVTVANGEKVAKMIITEPASNGNMMTVHLGGDTLGGNGSYTFSDVLYCEKGLNLLEITAEAISVPQGVTLESLRSYLTVTASYENSSIKDNIKDYELSCEDYNSQDVGTSNNVKITYQGKECFVTVTIVENPINTFELTVNDTQYSVTYAKTGESIINNDKEGAWWNGGTEQKIAPAGDFAVVYTWENTRDTAYTDVTIELLNPEKEPFDLTVCDGTDSGRWGALYNAASSTYTLTLNGAPVEKQNWPVLGTTGAFEGTFEAIIVRIGTTLTINVTFTQKTGDVYVYTFTQTSFTEANMTTWLTGNPYWVDNITYTQGTISEM